MEVDHDDNGSGDTTGSSQIDPEEARDDVKELESLDEMEVDHEDDGSADTTGSSHIDPEEARDDLRELESQNGGFNNSSHSFAMENSKHNSNMPISRRTSSYLRSLATSEAKLDNGILLNGNSSNCKPEDDSTIMDVHDVVPFLPSRGWAGLPPEILDDDDLSSSHRDEDYDIECDNGSSERASLISVSMHKKEGEGLGIRLKQINGELVISFVESDSNLASYLRAGDRVLDVDEHFCAKWNTHTFGVYVVEKAGPLSITVRNPAGDSELIQAVIFKVSPSSPVGIAFSKSLRGRQLKIKRILSEHAIGDKSILIPGDFVKSINNIPCDGMESDAAVDLIRDAPKYVSILATQSNETELSVRDMMRRHSTRSFLGVGSTSRRATLVASEIEIPDVDDLEAGLESLRPSLLSIKLSRYSTDVKLGVSFKKVGSDLCVSKIQDWGLLSASILKSGMTVISVNHNYCRKWDVKKALEFFNNLVGDIMIVAQDFKNGDPLQVAATAFKKTPRSAVGLALRTSHGRLEVNRVYREGLFADSVLSAGDKVLSINNILCYHLTTHEAAALVKHEPTAITVHGKTNTSNAIVISTFEGDASDQTIQVIRRSQNIENDNASDEGDDEDCKQKKFAMCVIVLAVVFVIIILAVSQGNSDA